MRKSLAITLTIFILTILAMTIGMSYAWFSANGAAQQNIVHEASSPSANIVVEKTSQSGTLNPAIATVDDYGSPSYISQPEAFRNYIGNGDVAVANYNSMSNHFLTVRDGVMLEKPATSVNVGGKFKFEGIGDDGTANGERTIVVELEAIDTLSNQKVNVANFSFEFKHDVKSDLTTTSNKFQNKDRQNFILNSVTHENVMLLRVKPSQKSTDWNWFEMSIYFSSVDDELDFGLSLKNIKFRINFIAV